MAHILIIGAGAIGRGFLPWCLPKDAHITFVDSSTFLVDSLKKSGGYTSFMSSKEGLQSLKVLPYEIVHISESHNIDFCKFDIAFISVGPRNIEEIPCDYGRLRCPIFSLENDPATIFRLRELLQKNEVYFGVPDVITSATASPENLACDPLSLHTEDGVLYLTDIPIPDKLKSLKAVWTDEAKLSMEWDAKLYIHNTPHCIAAYLGYREGSIYMHEAMQVQVVKDTVVGVVEEILSALRVSSTYPLDFLESYANKELSRFQDTLLFDSISRVARHPLRKLRPAPHGRLIGALELCLISGVFPKHLLNGIAAALHYDHSADDDSESIKLIKYYGISAFLWHFLAIPQNSLSSKLVSRAYETFNARNFQ